MTEQKEPVPKGYWRDANDALIPISKIKQIDKDRHELVWELCEQAQKESARLVGFKTTAMFAITEFIDKSLAASDVKHGGKKGNVTLISFDGGYKIVRAMQENIVFDERLQAAKAKIDQCINGWAKGSKDEIKLLINDAFRVDQEGKISAGRVLGLRRHDITDPNWLLAMKAIGDSMRVASTKPYIRFYKRDDTTGEYQPISLDVAAI